MPKQANLLSFFSKAPAAPAATETPPTTGPPSGDALPAPTPSGKRPADAGGAGAAKKLCLESPTAAAAQPKAAPPAVQVVEVGAPPQAPPQKKRAAKATAKPAAKPTAKPGGKRKRKAQAPKKKRVVLDSSDEEAGSGAESEEEAWSAGNASDSGGDDEFEFEPTDDEAEEDLTAPIVPDSPVKPKSKPARKKAKAASSPPPSRAEAKASPGGALEAGGDVKDGVFPMGGHDHHSWEWFSATGRQDKAGRRPGEEGYNARELRVPASFLEQQTGAMLQWWRVKADNADTVLFFKVGKFYELFHDDADVGVRELGCVFMKGSKAHSGFPEIAYSKFAEVLVTRGFRVARVEQTETPAMMKQRTAGRRGLSKDAKVVRREVCSMTTRGTRTYGHMDADELAASAADLPVEPLLVLVESPADGRLGAVVLDTPTATLHVGSFADDGQRTLLRTLLLRVQPTEVVCCAAALSADSLAMVKHAAARAVLTEVPANDLWDSARTQRELESGGYWQETPAAVRGDDEALMLALGCCVGYLRRCLIDHDVLSMRQIHALDVEQLSELQVRGAPADELVLDGVTLANLEVLQAQDGRLRGSLLHFMDRTRSPFGRRQFRRWLAAPLAQAAAIVERQDAVEALLRLGAAAGEAHALLAKVPDLDRLLARVHSMGSLARATEHPESRAIMYENETYGKRKIKALAKIVSGLGDGVRLVAALRAELSSSGGSVPATLVRLVEEFPDVQTTVVDFFKTNFRPHEAVKTGEFKPKPGVDAEYDAAEQRIRDVEQDAADYLRSQREQLGVRSATFWGKEKDAYQIELPDSVRDPPGYELKSKKKGARRYWTARTKQIVAAKMAAVKARDECMKDQMRRIFAMLDEHHEALRRAIDSLGELDCLLSLAQTSSGAGFCRPRVERADADADADAGVKPFVRLRESVHPALAAAMGGDFIPNDVQLGGADAGNMLLLSGPNMGGKSTLLRQTCVAVIMAQMGCFVPAAEMALTPVDRIFTRLGASDSILTGQSTFFVELAETANILQHATRHSLVILDELGRGTSTFDGTAIAHAVARCLTRRVDCRSMFATHYHSLVEEMADDPRVALGNMACVVSPSAGGQQEGEGEGEGEGEPVDDVTFLYKLQPGACPRSYGVNVARLARLPAEVIARAHAKSQEFEARIAPGMWSVAAALAGGEAGVEQVREMWGRLQ